MAHFAVVAPAFYSHFSALSALGAELFERGHRVTFLHRPDAAGFVSDARLRFHALGADRYPAGSLADTMRRAANPGGPLGIRRVILDMAGTTAMLCDELPGALKTLQIDALIGDQMEPAGALVAGALGLPLISVACALPVNREAAIPLPVMPFAYGTSERALKMVEGSTRVYDWMMTPHRHVVDQYARQFKLAPELATGAPSGMLHQWLSPLAQISQTVAAFDFPRTGLPAHFHHVGPLRSDQQGHPGDSGFALPGIDSARPLVFASLGTLQGQRFGLFKRIARACRQIDAQLLVAHCGGLNEAQAEAVRRAGATWVCGFAPQQAVLERADAVVSHGGLNTVMDAIAARTPILALPIAFDQPGVAARVSHAGVGLSASAHFASAAQLAGKLRRLLSEPGFAPRLEELAAKLAQAGGARRAADIVEHALGLNQSKTA